MNEHESSTGLSNRRAFLGGAAATGAGLVSGCLGASARGGRELTVGYQPFYAEAWSALVIKHAGLAERYLPEGYSVKNWDSALQGSIVGTRMISGKNQIGYTGDMPTITALANDETPIDAVGLAGYSQGQQCNLAVVPKGSNVNRPEEIDGRDAALTTGSCTHRFYLNVIKQLGVQPQLVDNGIGNILAEIRQGSLPVGFGWEPNMARAVYQEDEAEYLLTGGMYDTVDAAGIIMPASLIENDREAAIGWMKAELEAKRIMATDQERTLDLIGQEDDLSTFERETLRSCLYKSVALGPEVNRLELVTDYASVPRAERLLKRIGPQFLQQVGAISEVPPPARYASEIAQTAADQLGVETGLGRFGGPGGEQGPGSPGPNGTTTTGNRTGGGR